MKAPNSFVEAVLERQFESAKQLLSSGLDINGRYGDNQWTALHYSVECMAPQSTEWLLDNGADPNLTDTFGWTPLHLAIDVETDVARQQYVVMGGFPVAAKLATLLLQPGANPNARNKKGQTALMLAHSHGNAEAARVLEQYGARGAG